MKVDQKQLIVYLPDTRGTQISPFGSGNLKIGLNVFTYSRLPGVPTLPAVGVRHLTLDDDVARSWAGTCPGATEECQAVCYAVRPVQEHGPVSAMWFRNSQTEQVPAELPDGCTLLRLHISGDFTSVEYIDGWTDLIARHPHVAVWAYTRSWRVPALLPALERLRALPNVQLWASMDKSTPELPPSGWRRAWMDGDPRAGTPLRVLSHSEAAEAFRSFELQQTEDDVKTLICPEETKAVANCEDCGYCFRGKRNDVTFLLH